MQYYNINKLSFILGTKNAAATLIILLGAIIARAFASLVIKAIVSKFQDENAAELNKTEQRVQTLTSVVNNTFNIAIFGIATVMILSQWGIDIAPILTGAGIVGLAVGFGAQALVRDIVTGFFILLENQYNVGDRVKIAGMEGKILEINLRTTILKENDGTINIIPNSQIGTISTNIPKSTPSKSSEKN